MVKVWYLVALHGHSHAIHRQQIQNCNNATPMSYLLDIHALLIQILKATMASGLQTPPSTPLLAMEISVVNPIVNLLYNFLTLMGVKLPFQFHFKNMTSLSISIIKQHFNIISCSAH